MVDIEVIYTMVDIEDNDETTRNAEAFRVDIMKNQRVLK